MADVLTNLEPPSFHEREATAANLSSPALPNDVLFKTTCAVSDGGDIVGPFSKKETCIVLDWDDTLFPSSFIDRKKLLTTRSVADLPEDMQRTFRELERVSKRLVTTAAAYGDVLIITNAQVGWVELCVSRFMPNMMTVLAAHTRVISARSTFERFFPGDPLCWKAATFAHAMQQVQKETQTPLKNILSFGDSMEERTAVQIAAAQLRSRAKSVKFLDAPSPHQLHQQLEVVCNNLEWIWGHNGDLDVVLTLEPSHDSLSPPPSPTALSLTHAQ